MQTFQYKVAGHASTLSSHLLIDFFGLRMQHTSANRNPQTFFTFLLPPSRISKPHKSLQFPIIIYIQRNTFFCKFPSQPWLMGSLLHMWHSSCFATLHQLFPHAQSTPKNILRLTESLNMESEGTFTADKPLPLPPAPPHSAFCFWP